jgi:hypothetical protein
MAPGFAAVVSGRLGCIVPHGTTLIQPVQKRLVKSERRIAPALLSGRTAGQSLPL